MSQIYTSMFPIEKSKCRDCVHRTSRLLLPLYYESFGIDPEEYELDDDEELLVEQHTCTAINQDMVYIVLECNQYERKNKPGLFGSDVFKI